MLDQPSMNEIKKRHKKGVALGTGAARGLAHIGSVEYVRARECIAKGENAAKEILRMALK